MSVHCLDTLHVLDAWSRWLDTRPALVKSDTATVAGAFHLLESDDLTPLLADGEPATRLAPVGANSCENVPSRADDLAIVLGVLSHCTSSDAGKTPSERNGGG